MGFWVPLGVQAPLPVPVTVPHSYGPEPTKIWAAIGSNEAATSVGLTVMRDAGKTAQLNDPVLLQLTVDPDNVYCDLPQPDAVVHVVTALSQAEPPAFVQ